MTRTEAFAWAAAVIAALFVASVAGTWWAQMLCWLVRMECAEGPGLIGGGIGFCAAVAVALFAGWRAINAAERGR